MNLRSKMNQLENQLSGANSNPLLAGTHDYHCVVTIGGANPGTYEWIENKATGNRSEVTPEWRKIITEYYRYEQPGIVVQIRKRETNDEPERGNNGAH